MTAVPPDDTLNDIGNAERFATGWAGTLAYVPEVGIWRRWDRDPLERRRRRGVTRRGDHRSSWFDDLARESDQSRQKRLLAHAQRTLQREQPARDDRHRQDARLDRPAARMGRGPALDGRRERHPRPAHRTTDPADPRHRIAKAIAVKYQADATAPLWCAFLDRIMGGDLAMIAFLQRAVGYSLTGSTSEQCLFIAHGTGANGKSVFLRTLRELARRLRPRLSRRDAAREAGQRASTTTSRAWPAPGSSERSKRRTGSASPSRSSRR